MLDTAGYCWILLDTAGYCWIPGWTAAQSARWHGEPCARAQRLLAPLPGHCPLVTVIEGYAATLSWLDSVAVHQTISLESSIWARPALTAGR